jgi:hypothetical protein
VNALLSRPSTSFFIIARKTWMPGIKPGMADQIERAVL